MAKKHDIKNRVLAIERMFLRKRPLTVPQIIRKLDLEYDIQVNRKTIYDDIAVLTMFMPIDTFKKGNSTYFHLIDLCGGG